MNNLQLKVLEGLVSSKVESAMSLMDGVEIPTALFEALDCGEHDLEDAILEVLENQSYIESDEMGLSINSIDTVLEFAEDRELTLEFGFRSILETFVIVQIGIILDFDLLEHM